MMNCFSNRMMMLIFIIFAPKNTILCIPSLPHTIARLYKDVPILVTGGCGFIGSHLVEELVLCGADVTIIDNLSSGNQDNISTVADKVTFIYGDITDFATCLHATRNKKIIFHLAAFISVPASTINPYECHCTNIIGTNNVLEAARINNVERFIFSSTCAVYGESDTQCNEEEKTAPASPYGFSKLVGETLCREYCHVFGLETAILRYFNVYGPRQNPHSNYAGVIAKFTHNMEHNLPLTIFGDGMQTRDYVSVSTVVQANMLLGICDKQYVQGDLFNIASGNSINLIELIDILGHNYPAYDSQIIFMPDRPGDIKHIAADNSKYKNLYDRLIGQFE